MSKKAKAIQTLYKMGRIDAEGVKQAVRDGIISEEECNAILGVEEAHDN